MSTRSRRTAGGDGATTLNPAMIQLFDTARLKKELEMRGLSIVGQKHVLADRLYDAVSTTKKNIDSLSDDELRQQLTANGVNTGPITDHSRGIYIKKLIKIVASGSTSVRAPLAAPIADHEQQQRKKKEPTQPTNEGQDSDFEEGEESMRFLTGEEMLTDMNLSRRSPQQHPESFSMNAIRCILVVVTGIFLFFLFEGAVKGNKEHF